MKLTAGAGALLARPRWERRLLPLPPKMIGIQIGALSFADEGTEKVLDVLQERVFTYGRSIAGRQIPGYPLPGPGKHEHDLRYHGGNFATPHPQYYKKQSFSPPAPPDHGSLDILAEVLPAAKKPGMRVICWMEDIFHRGAFRTSNKCRSETCRAESGDAQQPELPEFLCRPG